MELSQKQYNSLLTAIQTAGTVYAVLGDMVDEKFKKQSVDLDELESHVLEYAKDFNREEVIEIFDNKKVFNEDFVNRVIDDLREYDEYVFWEELVNLMAKKDLEKIYGLGELKKMDRMLFLEKLSELEEKYWNEIEKNGLANLELKSE